MKRLVLGASIMAILAGYLYLAFEDQKVLRGLITTIPAIPASAKLPDPVVPTVSAVTSSAPAERQMVAPGVVAGVGINPLPGVYQPGWGPCPEGQSTFGPGGAMGWGCPITSRNR